MEMLTARGPVWLRRFNLAVLGLLPAFLLIYAWRNMVLMHPRLYRATQMRGSWLHASMVVGFAVMPGTGASQLFGRDCVPAAPESDA